MPEVANSIQTQIGKNNVCMGCGLMIKDQFILKCSPDLQWHESCLKCAECDCKLKENSTCFVKNGKPYCKNDYTRLFLIKCNKCGDAIKKNDLVMKSKSNIYHFNCFSCNVCNKKLLPGDEYQIRDDQLYCKEDAINVNYPNSQLYLSNLSGYNSMSLTPENSVASSYSPSNNSSSSSIVDSPNNSSNFSNFNFNPYNPSYSFMDHNNSEFQEKEDDGSVSDDDDDIEQDDDDNDNSISEESSLNESVSSNKNKKKSQIKLNKPTFQSNYSNNLLKVNQGHHKPARIRTVLNEKQLHTLRACYGANPRPDALMKEQLVELTGLNPRVIRVWFQNKRCKDKKKNMLARPDQIQQQQQQNQLNQHMQIPIHHQYTNHSISNHIPQNHLMYDNCY